MSNEITNPLTFLINKSFENGCFPQKIKIGIIKPLYKKEDKSDKISYRTLTLISNISKFMEKNLKIGLSKFINK